MPSVRPKKYLCPEKDCGKAYNRPALLRQHERTHSNERPFVCSEHGCDKAFFRKAHLETHVLSHLSNENKPFQCPVCGKGMTSTQRLKRHEVIHTKSFKCTFENCDKAFYVWQSLKYHVDMDHKRVRTCEHCNKTFQTSSLLSKHIFKHHGEVSLFPCHHPGCFQAFRDKFLFDKHKQEVHPELRCPRCDKVCIGTEALETHLQIHVNTNGPMNSSPDSVSMQTKIRGNQSAQTLVREGLLKMEDIEGLENDEDSYYLDEGASNSSSNEANRSVVPVGTLSSRSDAAIINVVKNRSQKTYTCPRRNCGKVYVRLHAYEKHLERHEADISKADETLRRLRTESAFLFENRSENDDIGQSLDKFSDVSDFEEGGDVEDEEDVNYGSGTDE